MTIDTSLRTARVLRAVRLAMLGLVSVVIAHDAIFAAQYGFGSAFARAMRDGGHDGYWPAFSMVAVVAATVLGLRAVVRYLPRPTGHYFGDAVVIATASLLWAVVSVGILLLTGSKLPTQLRKRA